MAGAGFKDFAVGEVLTASDVDTYLMQQAVMVFPDSGARGSALGTAVGAGTALAEGMLTYNKDSGKLEIYNGTSWAGVSAVKKIAAFTASGTWTVPAGVTYAIAHMRGGGGGSGAISSGGTSGGNGGTSSVAFASGTVSAAGGTGIILRGSEISSTAGATNSGAGAGASFNPSGSFGHGRSATDGAFTVHGADVTPAASITVTVGAGGSAGSNGATGGSGFVYIEYYE